MKFSSLCIVFLTGWLTTACRPSDKSVIQAYAFQTDSLDGWGLIAADGCMAVPAGTYPQAPSTVVNEMFTVPDSTGRQALYHIAEPLRPVCPQRFARIGHFFEEVAPAQESPTSPILLIDKQGNVVFSTAQCAQHTWVYMRNFSDGRALVATEQGKYGYIDTSGNTVIPPIYARACDFREGKALVALANQQGELGYLLIDTEGNVCQVIQQSRAWLDQKVGSSLLLTRNQDTRQFVYLHNDRKNTLFLPQDVTEAHAFQHEVAVIRTNSGAGVIDTRGNILIPPQYTDIRTTNTDVVHVQLNRQWAVFSRKGVKLSDFQYDYLSDYYAHGLTVAGKNRHYFFMDAEGKAANDKRYTHLAVDATALRKTPQCFLQQTEPACTANGAGEKQSELTAAAHKEEQPGKADGGTRQNTPAALTPVKEHTLQTDRWKEITQNNPFFEEARKVLSGKLNEKDAANRRMILNYVEHLRTAYTTKDIDFLRQAFSENALIIVGKVIQSARQPEGGYLTPDLVLYNVKSKREYLERLRQVFMANRKIDVQFSNFHIMRHPTLPGIYGVSLRQGYTSDLYSDDGYLFLLWDFRDPAMPKIHVRTWQPSMLNSHTPLPEDEVFSISNFHLN